MSYKKILNIVLIIFVAIIWSIVGYRLFKNEDKVVISELDFLPVTKATATNMNKNKKEILLSQKNPFDKDQKTFRLPKQPSVVAKLEVVKDINTSNKKPNIISYHGNLTDNTGNTIHLLKINRQIKRFRIGQKIGDVTLVKLINQGILILDGKDHKKVLEVGANY